MQIKIYHLFNFSKRSPLKQTLNHISQFKETFEIYIINQSVMGIYSVDDIIYNTDVRKKHHLREHSDNLARCWVQSRNSAIVFYEF